MNPAVVADAQAVAATKERLIIDLMRADACNSRCSGCNHQLVRLELVNARALAKPILSDELWVVVELLLPPEPEQPPARPLSRPRSDSMPWR